jgi:hypothetical protein
MFKNWRGHTLGLSAILIVTIGLGLAACNSEKPANPGATVRQPQCAETNYGNDVWYVSGEDLGTCLSWFMANHPKANGYENVSIAPFLSTGDNNNVIGYFVVKR